MKRLIALLLITLISFGAYGAGYGKRQTANIDTLTNDDNGILTVQSIGAAGAITMDGALVSGGVATITAQPKGSVGQKISFESAGDDSGITFTIIGTDPDGKDEREVLTGGDTTTVHSARWYFDVKSITASGASAGNVTIGVLSAQGAVTKTLVPDLANYTSLMAIVTGTADTACVCTYTVEHTLMNMPSSVEANWFGTLALTAIAGTDTESNIVTAVGGVRGKLTAYTSGTFEVMILQDQKK